MSWRPFLCLTRRFRRSHQHRAALSEALSGRLLTGILVEDKILFLRFTDLVAQVDLETRALRFGGRSVKGEAWLTFPGWLKIQRVIEDNTQIILEVTGTLYTMRINVRKSAGRSRHALAGPWHIVLQGGRHLAA